jgi:DNA-binding Lrp family transcriptional regulator
MEITKRKVLELIENDARLTAEQISVMLGKEEAEIKGIIKNLEDDGTVRGYKALVDWDKTEKETVRAFIELKVSPQVDRGFEKIAERIYSYPEVRDMYLMSGSYDFLLLIEGRTLKEVALFVAEKLSPIEGVLSTSTHFMLRKYKDMGVVFGHEPEKDEREGIL